MRTAGLVIVLYAGPMILWGLLKLSAGGKVASDGTSSTASVITAWGVYLLAGIILLLLARPLALLAARGLDQSDSNAPTA